MTPTAPALDAALLARRLAALEHGEIRARAAARALGAVRPAVAAPAIAALARDGAAIGRAALAAIAQALADPDPELPYAWRADLYAAARDAGLDDVAALVLSPPPLRAWSPPREADARLAHLTLGHKKAFARAQRDPDLLARLAAEGDPTVVAELLRNPGLTEAFVVRIAARRPCRPETLRCIFDSRTWRTRRAVARAVARNPYAEPEIAVKLAATLPRADLAALAEDGAVHPLVRGLAERIARTRTGS